MVKFVSRGGSPHTVGGTYYSHSSAKKFRCRNILHEIHRTSLSRDKMTGQNDRIISSANDRQPPKILRIFPPVPDFRNFGSRLRSSRPRIKNSKWPPQNTCNKGRIILWLYSKQMEGLPVQLLQTTRLTTTHFYVSIRFVCTSLCTVLGPCPCFTSLKHIPVTDQGSQLPPYFRWKKEEMT